MMNWLPILSYKRWVVCKWWWWWLVFYGHFCAHGRFNWPMLPPKVMKRSQRWNNLQICPRRDSNTGSSDMWSNTLQLDHGGAQGCILRGLIVEIPTKYRLQLLNDLHEEYQGIIRMEGLARSYLWYLGIDSDIENFVGSCKICLSCRKTPPTGPLIPSIQIMCGKDYILSQSLYLENKQFCYTVLRWQLCFCVCPPKHNR